MIELTYRDALRRAMPTYRRYRSFHDYAMEHRNDGDKEVTTRANVDVELSNQVAGACDLIAELFHPYHKSSDVRCDLRQMYDKGEW